jgi:hypothetical protein
VVHVVRVVEIDAPPDCTPVEWRLVTTEPIGSSDQVLAIVDAYRARWRIEVAQTQPIKPWCALRWSAAFLGSFVVLDAAA